MLQELMNKRLEAGEVSQVAELVKESHKDSMKLDCVISRLGFIVSISQDYLKTSPESRLRQEYTLTMGNAQGLEAIFARSLSRDKWLKIAIKDKGFIALESKETIKTHFVLREYIVDSATKIGIGGKAYKPKTWDCKTHYQVTATSMIEVAQAYDKLKAGSESVALSLDLKKIV